jgi:hypothetical protein
MAKSNRNLILVLITIYLSFAFILWTYFNISVSELVTVLVFGAIVILLMAVGLSKLGGKDKDKEVAVTHPLPKRYWAALISFMFAFVGALLFLVILLPFVGHKIFDLLREQWQIWWLGLVLLTAVLYPSVNKRLFKSTNS